MEGNTESRLAKHRQVVGAVAHGNGLRHVHLLHLGNESQQLSLSATVHNLSQVASGKNTVLVNLQFVSIDIVDAVLLLKVFAEVREPTRKDGNLVTVALEHIHQSVHTLRDRQVLSNILHHSRVETLEQSHTLRKALLEVNLAPHGPLRNLLHLVAHTGTHS